MTHFVRSLAFLLIWILLNPAQLQAKPTGSQSELNRRVGILLQEVSVIEKKLEEIQLNQKKTIEQIKNLKIAARR